MRLFVALPLLLLAGCADGGSEDTPQSEVQISAVHHLFGFRTLRGFGTFPLSSSVPATSAVVFTDRATLTFFSDSSTYTTTRIKDGSEVTSSAERYALDKFGSLSMYVTGSGREPSVVFRGGYSLAGGSGVNPDMFFTDRVSTPASQAVGLYVGMRLLSGQVELAGGWHVFSLHTIFDQSFPAAENVARGVFGAVSITAGDPGSLRDVSGTGTQNPGNLPITFGGTIQNVLSNGSGNGVCNLDLSFSGDARQFSTAATGDLVVGVDGTPTDGESGLVMMLRKFDAPTTPVDAASIDGTFLVGGYTVFVNPSNPGSDAFVGLVTLGERSGTSPGSFKLEATGNQGIDFSYAGTWLDNPDGSGAITITISGTNETWYAAIDRDYQTLILLDNFRETRSNNLPELNLLFGARKKPAS